MIPCPNCELATPGGSVRLDEDLNCITCGQRFTDQKVRLLSLRLEMDRAMNALKEHHMIHHPDIIAEAFERAVESGRIPWAAIVVAVCAVYLAVQFLAWAAVSFRVVG